MDKVEQVARLIRSKGVGVYFVTQNPADVSRYFGPIGQSRATCSTRLYGQDLRALRLAAEIYGDNARFNTQDAILQVGVGEAVNSFLEKGVPGC